MLDSAGHCAVVGVPITLCVRERECVCVCVCERESVCQCVCKRECVHEKKRKRERERLTPKYFIQLWLLPFPFGSKKRSTNNKSHSP